MPIIPFFRGLPSGLLCWWLLAAFGCGSKGAVSLSARVEGATLAVAPQVLGTQLTGEFDLVLELGSAAPGATSVTLGSFSLKNGQSTVVPSLELSASQEFPLEVGVGKSATVHFVLDSSALVDAAAADALCAGEVWYAGTVTDTLSDGKPTVASSNQLAPACP